MVKTGKQLQQDILSLCQDFLTIDEKRDVWMLPHASVAEYFESKGWTGWKCDAFVAKICLGFLEELQPDNRHKDFLNYVDKHWHKHMGRYDEWLGLNNGEEVDPTVAAALKRFLGSPNKSSDSYRKWAARIGDPDVRPNNMALGAMCNFGFYYTLRDWWREGRITEEMALQRNEWGRNSLGMAAGSGSLPICEYLTAVMDVMHPEAERHAGALKSALQMRNYDIFKWLVTKANADLNFLYQHSMTAAQYAASYHSEMLQWMVDHDLVDLEQENKTDYMYRGSNVLSNAAYEGNVESVRILLAAGANVNAAMRNGTYGSALVAVAAVCESERHVETAKLLLNKGADPNLPLRGGNYGSALEASMGSLWNYTGKSYGERESCSRTLRHMLLEAGADPTAVLDRGGHGSALTAAAFYGQRDFLKAVIDRIGVDKAIDVLRQGRHPDIRWFVDQDDLEDWRDTAAYLANEVGASKDILHGIGLWDAEPVRTGNDEYMEIRFTEYSQPNGEDSNSWNIQTM